jgi:hypothetical protein
MPLHRRPPHPDSQSPIKPQPGGVKTDSVPTLLKAAMAAASAIIAAKHDCLCAWLEPPLHRQRQSRQSWFIVYLSTSVALGTAAC